MFCARSRPTNKGNREQKPITKKLAEFHNQFVLLTMVRSTYLLVFVCIFFLFFRQFFRASHYSFFKKCNLPYTLGFVMFLKYFVRNDKMDTVEQCHDE